MSDGPVFRDLPSPRSSPRSITRPTVLSGSEFPHMPAKRTWAPMRWCGGGRRAVGDRDVGGLMVVLGAAAHFYGAAASRDRQADQQQESMAARPV
jgi:hypothetical protein